MNKKNVHAPRRQSDRREKLHASIQHARRYFFTERLCNESRNGVAAGSTTTCTTPAVGLRLLEAKLTFTSPTPITFAAGQKLTRFGGAPSDPDSSESAGESTFDAPGDASGVSSADEPGDEAGGDGHSSFSARRRRFFAVFPRVSRAVPGSASSMWDFVSGWCHRRRCRRGRMSGIARWRCAAARRCRRHVAREPRLPPSVSREFSNASGVGRRARSSPATTSASPHLSPGEKKASACPR